jgi:beta-phosphoglucomutase
LKYCHKMLSAVLFDLDGVIVETARFHYLAWRELAQDLGLPFDETKNEELKGVSRARSLELLLGDAGNRFSAAEKHDLCEKKNRAYLRLCESLSPASVLPGVSEFLDELRLAGIGTAVCSASRSAEWIIGRLGLVGNFDTVLGGGHVSRPKPDPEVFELARQKLGATAAGCLVVEDAAAGLAAARAAGMKCLGVGSPEVLGAADVVCADMTEVTLEFVRRLFTGPPVVEAGAAHR